MEQADTTMADRAALLAADQRFFDALVAADHDELDGLLAEGFLIVDVRSGSIGTRDELLGAVRSGDLIFPAIQVLSGESVVRRIGGAGIVIGRTSMSLGDQNGSDFRVDSRYTHVFTAADDDDRPWRLISAQGTEVRTP
jgi:hypothetical protein